MKYISSGSSIRAQNLQLTIMISIREADGDVKLVHPVGQGPSRVCSGSEQVGDGIFRTSLGAHGAV
jgi:hypothetical protein